MLKFLFPRLTPPPHAGVALFDAITATAREAHWYVQGEVPDTLEGRFRVLATIAALVMVRLEAEGEAGDLLSVALTERFIEVMESEHRELGVGDPKLGRTVRKLVGSLARRVELWRSPIAGALDWTSAVRQSLYPGDIAPDALDHSVTSLRLHSAKLRALRIEAFAEGRLE